MRATALRLSWFPRTIVVPFVTRSFVLATHLEIYGKPRLPFTKLCPHFLAILGLAVILIFLICFHEPLAKELHHNIRQSFDDAAGNLTSGEPTEFGKHRLAGDGVADDTAALRDLFA